MSVMCDTSHLPIFPCIGCFPEGGNSLMACFNSSFDRGVKRETAGEELFFLCEVFAGDCEEARVRLLMKWIVVVMK